MARGALQLGVRDLALAAKVSPSTVTRFEAGEELRERTLDALRAALETAGVEFIAENGGGAGVRLRARSEPEPQGPVDAPIVREAREMKAEAATKSQRPK